MKQYFLTRLIPALLLVVAHSVSATPGCDDFLSKLGDKPEFIEFQGCRQALDRQGQPYSARYQVTGADASEAERILGQQFGMPALQRACCIWESGQHSFRPDPTGMNYLISMDSGETLVTQRAAWPSIEHFYIQVDLFAEDP